MQNSKLWCLLHKRFKFVCVAHTIRMNYLNLSHGDKLEFVLAFPMWWWYDGAQVIYMKKSEFMRGLYSGIPICLGYVSVSFAFGIFAVESGLTLWQALLLSATGVTSAGQLAAVPIIVGCGGLLELAVSQLVINLRYSLMSISLSQKFDRFVGLFDRFAIAFVNTDEVFAVASGQRGTAEKSFMYGLILMPWLGWTCGTLLGAAAGNILPAIVTSALGVAIYGMFIAIVVPEAKRSAPTAICVGIAVLLSCLFYYIPVLSKIPSGFTVIICAVAASAVMAVLAPIKEEVQDHG